MISDSDGKKQASLLLVTDMLERILSHAGNAVQCADYITTQIRELVGVKMVVLMQASLSRDGHFELASVCPQRHADKMMRKEIFELCRLSENMLTATHLSPDTIHREGFRELAALGLSDSFIVPLRAGDEHVGTLLLLDLLAMEGVEGVVQVLQSLSGVIGLIFKNALFSQGLDSLVKQRTQELECEIEERKKAEARKEKLVGELQNSLNEIKTLRGILPLCSFCKKIRDDEGYWEQVDVYIHQHLNAEISHGICPDCMKINYPDAFKAMQGKKKE
ncbi:hypothetical protein [Desulfoluna sp.]|uniref:hypothetical protein n=1 Tax=Desulfoluna sp. TaxID=2045199 RepID=UPI0026354003|nr:hypothetical protein [Desulfoluna sp.]